MVITASVLVSVMLMPEATAHTEKLKATVEAHAQGTSAPQTHIASAGQWCASVAAITGSVGRWFLVIQSESGVVDSLGGWHPSPSTIGGVSCSRPIDAGEYLATLHVRGGRQGSMLTIELSHPE